MIFIDKLEETIADFPNFRKQQIYRAIFKSAYGAWENATDLPLDLRAELTSKLPLDIDSKMIYSGDERTVKALIRLGDDESIETVLMKSRGRNTVCVSTQVGCALGCGYCASGKLGRARNLSIGEIVGQVLLFSRFLKKDDEKVTNIVFMGMGEPFLNYDNVISSIRLLNQENTSALGARRFSISTAGILPGIKKLAAERSLEVNLAVSLNSAISEKRDSLMPISKKYPLGRLAVVLRSYFQRTGRKIMIEYVLLKEINMFEEDALALRRFLDSVQAAYVVNLIPLNDTKCGYQVPTNTDVHVFRTYLEKYKVSYIQRASFGKDIDAACGQLARRPGTT